MDPDTASRPDPQPVPPYQPPPAPAGRPPLRRRREGRMIAGVAAGLAAHLGVDVTIVRIVFVVVAIITEGVGVLAYVIAALLIPAERPEEATVAPPGHDTAERANGAGRDELFWVGVVLLVLGALWLLGGPSPSFWPVGRDLLWPIVLIGFGLALWRASDRSGASTSSTSETIMTTEEPRQPGMAAPAETTAPLYGQAPPSGAVGNPPPPTPPVGRPYWDEPNWTPPPEPPRERSLLTRITLGIALVTVGVLWLLRMAGIASVTPSRIVAAALLVVGLGLLVGSVAGRGRWLILVGALLVPVVIAAELLRPLGFVGIPGFVPRDGVGERIETPVDLDDLRPSYQLGAGSLLLDLSLIEVDRPTRIVVQVGAGEVDVRLPEDITAEVTARVGAGELTVDDRRSSGLGLQRSRSVESGDGSDLLELDIQVGFGEITVTPSFEVESAPEPEALSAPDRSSDVRTPLALLTTVAG